MRFDSIVRPQFQNFVIQTLYNFLIKLNENQENVPVFIMKTPKHCNILKYLLTELWNRSNVILE